MKPSFLDTRLPPKSRSVLIHYHIFKNAGTSIDAALRRSFGDRWDVFEGDHAHDVQKSTQLAAWLESRPELRAVSSHMARPPLPFEDCRPIVFLRHPVLRARSVYGFLRRDPIQFNSDIARSRDFASYLRWALEGGRGGIVIRNYQVVHLSDASFRSRHILDARATAEDLRQAKDLIADWGAVGVVEEFEASARRLWKIYQREFPELDFVPFWLNRTSGEPPDVEHQTSAIRAEIGPGLYDRLVAANSLDLDLYFWARSMSRRVARIH